MRADAAEFQVSVFMTGPVNVAEQDDVSTEESATTGRPKTNRELLATLANRALLGWAGGKKRTWPLPYIC